MRWQVAFAVLVPSIAVALFSGFYFPDQQRKLALDRLEDRTRVVGLIAADDLSAVLDQAGVTVPDRSESQPVASRDGSLRAVPQVLRVFDRVEQVGAVWATSNRRPPEA